jgi:hypothetical protein
VENIRHYRAIALLCRQQAVLHPEASWQWLADAERYEHLADDEVAAHFNRKLWSNEFLVTRAIVPAAARMSTTICDGDGSCGFNVPVTYL